MVASTQRIFAAVPRNKIQRLLLKSVLLFYAVIFRNVLVDKTLNFSHTPHTMAAADLFANFIGQ